MVPVSGDRKSPSCAAGCAMALPLDNPSYFTVASGTLPSPGAKGKFRLFKKKMGATTSQEIISEVSLLKNPPNNCSNGRRPIRTLLRSVSSNSADSNQELLVLGEPRPSDIAPPSPYLNSHRDDVRNSKRNKKSSEDTTDSLVYSPLATSEEAADQAELYEEDEEVFLSEDSAKYYNISAQRETGRRHSIGTYLAQERERALSVASSSKSTLEDAPPAIVHATADGEVVKPPSISSEGGRRRCHRCDIKGGECGSGRHSQAAMEDILIVSSRDSQAAALWVNYFSTCFDQITKQKERPSLKVVHVGVEEVGSVTGLEQRLANVKLHVVIVCPQLLEAVLGAHSAAAAALFRMLRPDRTIAMLLGVTDTQLNDQHHAAMHSYRQWQRHAVGHDQDQDFAREFLSSAMGILARAARQQHAAALEQRASFSVLPKKVKHSQNRLVVLLTEPLAREDVVKVSVDRNGELLEVKTVKRRNPYTLKFVMPDSCLEMSLIVQVLVEKNGNVLGARPVKCESRLRELDQILRSSNSPLEFMCQTLGLSPTNKEQLDNWMVNSFQRNVPPHFNLLAGPSAGLGAVSVAGSGNGGRHPHAHEEFPTLLHFAARFGLEKLSWALLEGPGGEAACELRNVADLSPAELAERAGHTKLASALRGYMQMNEFTNMYSQLKEMSQINPAPATSVAAPVEMDEDEYLLPRPAEQTYSIPPPARPCPRPITGYLEMQRSSPLREKQSESESTPTPSASNKLPSEANNISHNETTHNVHEDKVQAELAEIINDFKNNVFTLAEVEQLVQNWRNRNDVQKSFKEKEEQLNMMRRQYDRIQQVMKEEMKKATPFDRFKNLFSRRAKNKDGSDKKCEPPLIENKNANDSCSNHRPISSLSLQSTASSSSSGRMSTLSGCSAASLGDSGTHSDHEDRKHLMRQPSSDHEYFEIADPKKDSSFNYLVPPAPKPVYKYNQLKHNVVIERPPHPVPRPETPQQSGEYYIQFPPSGLPVNALLNPENKSKSRSTTPEPLNEYINPLEEPSSEYINIPAAGAAPQQVDDVSSSDALPEYMNFSPPPRNT